jgi:hypothetical protein
MDASGRGSATEVVIRWLLAEGVPLSTIKAGLAIAAKRTARKIVADLVETDVRKKD